MPGAGATRLYLVRHGAHALVDRVLVGRTAGVHLSRRGHIEAKRVAWRLRCEGLTAVHSSPRERALQTAGYIAAAAGLHIKIAPELDEADFGAWAGRAFSELEQDPLWADWNRRRGKARPPGGESMQEIQLRIVTYLDQLAADHAHARIALVSHAEVIRAALLHQLRLGLDDFHNIEVKPASVSQLVIDGADARVAEVATVMDEGHAYAFSG